jgi:hypothetical protein
MPGLTEAQLGALVAKYDTLIAETMSSHSMTSLPYAIGHFSTLTPAQQTLLWLQGLADAGVSPSTILPLVEGTAAIGTSLLYARADHVHPAGGGGGPAPSGFITDVLDGTNAWRSHYASPYYVKQVHFDFAYNTGAYFVYTRSDTGTSASSIQSEPNHRGIFQFQGTTTAPTIIGVQGTQYVDMYLNSFSKVALRFVVKIGNLLPTAANPCQFLAGFFDGTAMGNGFGFLFDPTVNTSNWLACVNASASGKNQIDTGVAATINTWYDMQIYYDSTGVQFRIGVYAPNTKPPLLAGGPFTSFLPDPTAYRFLEQVYIVRNIAGSGYYYFDVDLWEVVGAPATPGMIYRGESLVTAF